MKKYGMSKEKSREMWHSTDMSKVFQTHVPCRRCALCCKAGTCIAGKADKNGRCIFLKKLKNKRYSCELYAHKKINGSTIGIGNGCVIRALPHELSKFYEDRYGALP